ncbi:B3 domain-containing transcription factor VRN1 [Euphorbia peplus]|nr:B3 domain-containing transcription factor VRN1 [Euphorbia peplus]
MSNAVGSNSSEIQITTTCMFYKLMVPSILQENKLKIPIKFVKKYGKDLSSIATLTGPNGRIWVVELEKVDGKLWFSNGWHEFIDYYSIRVGNFLVFKYGGESNFHVHAYDLAVREIRYPCNSSGSLQNQCLMAQVKQEAEGDGSMEMFGSDPLYHTPVSSMQSNRTSSGEYEHEGEKLPAEANFGYSKDEDVKVNECALTTDPCKVVLPILGEAGRVTRRRRRQRTDSHVDELKPRTRQKFDRVSCLGIASETCTRRLRSVTQEEKEKAIRAADMYKTDSPFFKVILRPSYVYRGFLLHIPNGFARKYLTSFSEFIKLEVSEGKRWSVRCVCGNGKAKLCKGWTEFVWGNKLEEGDICVFELVDVKDVLKVTIFRVLEDEIAANA